MELGVRRFMVYVDFSVIIIFYKFYIYRILINKFLFI